jgi:L-serine kinase (ATP) / ParB family transcriptional regulator, heme-responsive regulator
MSLLPDLRVIPLAEIVPHENFDPLRVDRLARRMAEAGSQANPVVCVAATTGEFVLLDGATRTAALRHLGLEYALAQVVPADGIVLETWHHVIREAPPDAVLEQITASGDLVLDADSGTPRLSTTDGRTATVSGTGSAFGVLASLVKSYIGRWPVSRVITVDLPQVPRLYPDWSVVVEQPTLRVDDVMKAALSEDRLPAGVTRFVVPDRALRVNLDLDILAPGPQAERQAQLERVVADLIGEGRVRHYTDSIVIFDE